MRKTKAQLETEIEVYKFMLREFTYYIEGDKFTIEDLVKKLRAIKIIKEWFEVFEDKNGYHIRTLFDIGAITKEEYDLLKEVLL